MKKYFLSIMALLLVATALVSCDDDFDDIKVNYPEGFPMTGVWRSEYTNYSSWATNYENDKYEYTVIFSVDNEGKPTCTVLTYGKRGEDVEARFLVMFNSNELSYDAETGILTASGKSIIDANSMAYVKKMNTDTEVSFAYQSDMNTLSMQVNIDGDVVRVSTLKPATIPNYNGYQLSGQDDDGKYYLVIMNYEETGIAAVALAAEARNKLNSVKKIYSCSLQANGYRMVNVTTKEDGTTTTTEVLLTVNEKFNPVLVANGKTIPLTIAASDPLKQSVFE